MTNKPDTAYIQTDPNCIGPHFIEARGKVFERIAQIAKEMETIAESASKETEKSAGKLIAGEWYQNVVSIVGERGSGKTVLLLSACACLGKDTYPGDHEENEHKKIGQKVPNDILLPIIQPEYFGAEDTLITWILINLKDIIENNKERFGNKKVSLNDNEDDEIPLLSFIEEMRKDEVLFSRKFSSKLAEQDVTTADFQTETLKVVDAQHRFIRLWKQLVDNLIVMEIVKDKGKSTGSQTRKRPFLIIPIDDADLNPVALPAILQQMRLLQHSNVLFLFSFHMASLHSVMYLSQLEQNTNQTDARPVINFDTLIKHNLRDKENVRSDALAKIEKYLPLKYRVEIQSLTPKERLNFKPLIKQIKQKNDDIIDDGTFLALLEKIPRNIFGNERLISLAELFDLTQSFKQCPVLPNSDDNRPRCIARTPENDCSFQYNSLGFCGICDIYQKSNCYTVTFNKSIDALKEKPIEDNKEIKKIHGDLCPPVPSIYADALPKFPRAMDQLYQIMYHWVEAIKSVRSKSSDKPLIQNMKEEKAQVLNDKEKKIIDETEDETEKELRKQVSKAAKELLMVCIGFITRLPIEFSQRIRFIDNPNTASRHPLQMEFDKKDLSNYIGTSAEGITIGTFSIDNNISGILNIHTIVDYSMLLLTKTLKNGNEEEKELHKPPRNWFFSHIDEKSTPPKEYYSASKEYFAVYNLAYDLTTNNGIFGKTIHNISHNMRNNYSVSIFTVRAGTSNLFTDCYCAMPQWYRMSDYNLFALAWNRLVSLVNKEIIKKLGSLNKLGNQKLSDWIVLALLRIHVCLEMNYAPFMVTEEEIKNVCKAIENANTTDYEQILSPMKKFVKQGLQSVMEFIKSGSKTHVLSKHQRAFKTWIEYGLPMLSNSNYVSNELGKWIVYQWIMLLITHTSGSRDNNEKNYINLPDCFFNTKSKEKCDDKCNKVLKEKYGYDFKRPADERPADERPADERPADEQSADKQSADEQPGVACYGCAYPRLRLIQNMLDKPPNKLNRANTPDEKRHSSYYFLQEYTKDGNRTLFHQDNQTATKNLQNILNKFIECLQQNRKKSRKGNDIDNFVKKWVRSSGDGDLKHFLSTLRIECK